MDPMKKILTPELVRKWAEAYGIAQDFDLDDARDMLLNFAEWANFRLEQARAQELLVRWQTWVRIHRAEQGRTKGEEQILHMVKAACFEVAATELEIAIRNQLLENIPGEQGAPSEAPSGWARRRIILLENRMLDLEQAFRSLLQNIEPLLEKEE